MSASSADVVTSGYRERERVVRAFFAAEADRVAELCLRMAERFTRGGRLLAFGVGAAATDAQHVSVEFVHPVIVGKRALPAIALPNDIPSALGLALREREGFFATQLGGVGRPADVALGIVHSKDDADAVPVERALQRAGALGMLSVRLAPTGRAVETATADFDLEVDSEDPFVVQEVHETLYHVLWELVHVFFEHKGLLERGDGAAARDPGRSSFLYPFLSESESNLEGVLDDVRASVVMKSSDVITMRASSRDPGGLAETAQLMAERVAAGGKVLAFGNGGSATDAQDLVVDLTAPPLDLKPVPALALTNDAAVVTAVGNDVGFDNVFSRQVIAYGNERDVAVAISTSGGSRNVVAAVEEARRRGLLTIGLVGYGGGRLAEVCETAHVIDADYIPRIQEVQATQYHLIRRLMALELGLLPGAGLEQRTG